MQQPEPIGGCRNSVESTRQVANLLAAAAPEVLPPSDTLRAVAPDRYTLKVSIDQECERGLRLLKDLMSHLDPRMSWGDLVARVVREAVARHDPSGGGRGQRRKGADSAGASPRRTPKETRTGGAAGGPARRSHLLQIDHLLPVAEGENENRYGLTMVGEWQVDADEQFIHADITSAIILLNGNTNTSVAPSVYEGQRLRFGYAAVALPNTLALSTFDSEQVYNPDTQVWEAVTEPSSGEYSRWLERH